MVKKQEEKRYCMHTGCQNCSRKVEGSDKKFCDYELTEKEDNLICGDCRGEYC